MPVLLPQRIDTARLTLRQPRAADAACIFDAYAQDPDVARYMVWRPHRTLDETEAFIAYCVQDLDSGRSRPFVLTRRGDDDAPIGMLEARILPKAIDIGYVLRQSYWGSGLMTEALHALSGAALEDAECFRVQATCDTENHASARVLEKAGFTLEGRLERHLVLPNLSDEPRASLMYARCR